MIQKIIHSLKETNALAKQLSSFAKTGDTFLLYGTLGIGKTAFTRAFIQSLTRKEENVPSPTFTLLQTYEGKKGPLFHFDLYRLEKESEVYELGIEDAFYEGICLIEWPELIENQIFSKRVIEIHISLQGENRLFEITARDEKTEQELLGVLDV